MVQNGDLKEQQKVYPYTLKRLKSTDKILHENFYLYLQVEGGGGASKYCGEGQWALINYLSSKDENSFKGNS